MSQPAFCISNRQSSAITRIEWARYASLRVELGQSYDYFTTRIRIFQTAREAT